MVRSLIGIHHSFYNWTNITGVINMNKDPFEYKPTMEYVTNTGVQEEATAAEVDPELVAPTQRIQWLANMDCGI